MDSNKKYNTNKIYYILLPNKANNLNTTLIYSLNIIKFKPISFHQKINHTLIKYNLKILKTILLFNNNNNPKNNHYQMNNYKSVDNK